MGSIAKPCPYLRAALSFGLFALAPSAIGAAPALSDNERIALCIRSSSQGVDWLERTLWGLRDQEGGSIGSEVPNTNGTHDLGPLQINSWWIPRIASEIDRPRDQVRAWLRYDPCFNVAVAKWIFLASLKQTRSYWLAVGHYHSPTAWRQRRYALSVSGHLRRRYGQHIFARKEASGHADD